MNYAKKILLPSGRRGMDLLDTPVWNKGTAFDDNERAAFGLQGLIVSYRGTSLPSAILELRKAQRSSKGGR
jgi:hypothetical protein